MSKIALIIGSTRPNRFADHPARWIADGARQRSDFQLDLLDLRDAALPFFDEPVTPAANGGTFRATGGSGVGRQAGRLRRFHHEGRRVQPLDDGVLKNALDSAFGGWKNKPVAFVGYGGSGGARAIEHLRLAVINLQMAPISVSVNIAMQVMQAVVKEGKALESFDHLNRSRSAMFDQLAWWTNALKAARAA